MVFIMNNIFKMIYSLGVQFENPKDSMEKAEFSRCC